MCGEEGGWSSARLRDAFAARGCDVFFFEPGDCSLRMDGGAPPRVLHRGIPFPRIDLVAVKKIGDVTERATRGRLEILFALEGAGVPVRSRPASIARAIDRVRMTRTLAEHGIPAPRTLVTDDVDLALDFLDDCGACIHKPPYTSKGRGMKKLLASDREGARALLSAWKARADDPIYLQAFVEREGDGDLGIALLEGEVLGAYRRVAPEGSWLTTIAEGGHYAPAAATPDLTDLARRAAAPFDLTFTGVDIVETRDGPLVYEVSAFGGFRGLWETARLDAAAILADRLLSDLQPLSQ